MVVFFVMEPNILNFIKNDKTVFRKTTTRRGV